MFLYLIHSPRTTGSTSADGIALMRLVISLYAIALSEDIALLIPIVIMFIASPALDVLFLAHLVSPSVYGL